MRLIPLEQAIVEIHDASQRTQAAAGNPFFYIVGAGLSSPPIPLSREIVDMCRDNVLANGRSIGPPPGSAMDEYSFWFQEAFRQPVERPLFLRGLMEGKPLSRANWRLAHLLSSGKVANLVVTPNFDDMLSRALSLLGVLHVLCDHPVTAPRIDEDSTEVQILHVHGTYRFYDCCNLAAEIGQRAQPSPLSARLDGILARRTPLVIGYAGWEQDVIMQALRRRMDGNQALPRTIYWFCYSQGLPETLPNWLRNHPNVTFVVPQTQTSETNGATIPGSPVAPSEKQPHSPRLPAHVVFDALIGAFAVESPALTRDPLGFLANRIRTMLLAEESEDEEVDPYLLAEVVDRIERAKERDARGIHEAERRLEIILDKLRSSLFEEAIDLVAALQLGDLPLGYLERLIQGIRSTVKDTEQQPTVELRFYEYLQALLEERLRRFEGVDEICSYADHENGGEHD